MRHYAAKALTECTSQGALTVSQVVENLIGHTNVSKYPKSKRTNKIRRGFYEGRPDNAPKPVNEFYLDYDFEKYEVSNLADAFGLSNWEVKDRLAEVANSIDPKVKSMNEADGRYKRYSSRGYGMVDEYHSYGEQLGWHSLQIVAGKILEEFPVMEDDYHKEPWSDWIDRYALTIESGLWLSDGTDNTPLDVNTSLIEKTKKGDGITGDENKIKEILRITEQNKFEEVTIDGFWKTPDSIDVNIDSALVDPAQAPILAKRLLRGDPFMAYLPVYGIGENGNEYLYDRERKGYLPLIAHPDASEGFDKEDPFGTIRAITRPRFSDKIQSDFSLTSDTPFAKEWSRSNNIIAKAEAWKYNISSVKNREEGGSRFICKANLLRDILVKEGKDLLILVKLQRYKEGYGSQPSRFSNTTAVVHINSRLKVTYFKGAVNKEKKNRY